MRASNALAVAEKSRVGAALAALARKAAYVAVVVAVFARMLGNKTLEAGVEFRWCHGRAF